MLSANLLLAGVLAIAGGAGAVTADSAAPTAAVAPAAASPAVVHPHVLAFNLGLGSAVGFFGITYLYSGLNPFEVEAGVGEGWSGTQGSLMIKLALGAGAHRFVTGVGIADTIGPRGGSTTSGNPVWLNLDLLGYEFRGHTNFFFGAALGYTRGLGGGGFCAGDADCQPTGQSVTRTSGPQLRLLFGLHF